jgi:hypothetical protein
VLISSITITMMININNNTMVMLLAGDDDVGRQHHRGG